MRLCWWRLQYISNEENISRRHTKQPSSFVLTSRTVSSMNGIRIKVQTRRHKSWLSRKSIYRERGKLREFSESENDVPHTKHLTRVENSALISLQGIVRLFGWILVVFSRVSLARESADFSFPLVKKQKERRKIHKVEKRKKKIDVAVLCGVVSLDGGFSQATLLSRKVFPFDGRKTSFCSALNLTQRLLKSEKWWDWSGGVGRAHCINK